MSDKPKPPTSTTVSPTAQPPVAKLKETLAKEKLEKIELKEKPEKHEHKEKPEKQEHKEKPEKHEFKEKPEKQEHKEKIEHKEFKLESKELSLDKQIFEGSTKDLVEGSQTGPVGDPVETRVTALEQSVQQLNHFITTGQRPDLSQGALKGEADAGG